MSISLNDNIYVNAGKPSEPKSLNGVVYYTDLAQALSLVPVGIRYLGLVLNITGGVQYIFKNGVSDGDAVLYASSGSLTQGGDSPASTLRAGTNNAQSFAIITNNADRLTVDASGNIVQAGSTTNFDLVIPRIRNTVGGFFQFVRNTVLGQLDIGGDFTEINFTKPITNLKGVRNRMVETNSAGGPTAVEEIIPFWIYNPTVWGLLSNSANWNQANVYVGTSLTSYLLEQSQVYTDGLYRYEMIGTTVPVRIPLHRVRRRLTQQTTDVNNVGVSIETDLWNYNLPANSLNKNNDSITGYFAGYFAGSAAGELKIYIGGTVVLTDSAVVSVGDSYILEYRIIRTASNTQKIFVKYIFGSSASTARTLTNFSSTFLTDSAIINLKITGKDTTTGKVVLSDVAIDHVPSI